MSPSIVTIKSKTSKTRIPKTSETLAIIFFQDIIFDFFRDKKRTVRVVMLPVKKSAGDFTDIGGINKINACIFE